MATGSSSQLKLVPEKLKNYVTEQDKEYFSSQETDDVFVSGESGKEKCNRKERRFRPEPRVMEYYYVFFLALLAIFAFPSPCINLYSYHFDNIISTKIYSLDHSTNCDNKFRESKTKEEGSLIYAEVQPDKKLKFCIYEEAYKVSAPKKSNDDDVGFLTENSRLPKSIYHLNEGVCTNIWQNKNFAMSGFWNRTYKVNKSVTETI